MATSHLALRRAASPPMGRAQSTHMAGTAGSINRNDRYGQYSHVNQNEDSKGRWKTWQKLLMGMFVIVVAIASLVRFKVIPQQQVPGLVNTLPEEQAPAAEEKPVSTISEYLIVGVQNEPEFSQTVAFSWRLKDQNVDFKSRALAFPSKEKFDVWMSKAHIQYNIPEIFVKNQPKVVVFRGDQFLGGAAALRSDAHASGYSVTAKQSVRQQQQDQPRVQKQEPQPQPQPRDEQSQQAEEPLDLPEISKEELAPPPKQVIVEQQQQPIINREIAQPGEPLQLKTAVSTPIQPIQNKQLTYLPAQVTFKNRVIASYRSNSEKPFTNYLPFAQALTGDMGWQFMYQAPLLASIILVSDQTSAATAMVRYPKAMVNNIGWGGQSCLGGTKGFQIQCRSQRAEKDGCNYYDLKVQPVQYRLWIAQECQSFFQTQCSDEKQMWIQKPSGGQHGVGMKVHMGCEQLKRDFEATCASGDAAAEASNGVEVAPSSSTQKKYFVMKYLQTPLLDGHKFDVRTYALIASLDPLIIFYSDGFVRKATKKYSTENLKDDTAHITNSHSQQADQDHFWDFSRLSAELAKEPHNFPANFMETKFRSKAKKVTEFVMQAARENFKRNVKGRFQLFAMDWIVDVEGQVHLLEVNSNPLVTIYPGLEHQFPFIWKELMQLTIDIQTGSMLGFKLVPKKFKYGTFWHLVMNELQENLSEYNSCKAFVGKEEEEEETEPEGSSPPQVEPQNGILPVNKPHSREKTHVIPCPNQLIAADRPHCRACVLAPGSEDETIYHVITSDQEGPTIVIVAGVHGNEGAGVVAARHVAKHWHIAKGTLVVLERANARGVALNHRFVPAAHHDDPTSTFYDLNRQFIIGESTSSKLLVNAIWELMRELKPDLLFDLHEGRAFFAASSAANGAANATGEGGVLQNVGSTTGGGKVSKGNSIVTSLNAEPLAKIIAKACNSNIDDLGRKFLIMAPPIIGGLASKVEAHFHTKVMLFETTLVFPLETRVRQHLFMLSVALKAVGVLPQDFDHMTVGGNVEPCVATRKGCNVRR